MTDQIKAGIGGWLLLLIIKLSVGAVGRGLSAIGSTSLPLILADLAFAGVGGAAVLMLGYKNPKGVLFAKIYLAADAIYYLLAIVNSALGDQADMFRLSGFFVASLLYFLYLFKSERVKNTYFPQRVFAGQEDTAS